MTRTDLLQEEGFRLQGSARGPANADAGQAFHSIPKASLEAGTSASENIA
jgi:hypothetical protein